MVERLGKSNNHGFPWCVCMCVCVSVRAYVRTCVPVPRILWRDTRAFLPGLLIRAVRLPDNLAKKNLHSKCKHRQVDPGNDRQGKRKETHKQTTTRMLLCEQNKMKRAPKMSTVSPYISSQLCHFQTTRVCSFHFSQ